MRVTLWTNAPTHHQRAFLDALRSIGVNLTVFYHGKVGDRHQALGWSPVARLPEGEHLIEPSLSVLDSQDWRDRIHIVTGYRAAFFRKLVVRFSRARVPWMHWSEPAHGGWRWWASYPAKAWYAAMVNRYALGGLAIGELARRDFLKWGMRPDKIDFLPYAVRPGRSNVEPDPELEDFASRFKCVFLYLGALEKRKATDILLSAFHAVACRYPEACLLLVGSDNGAGLYKRMVEERGLRDRVYFRGPVLAGDIDTVLACSDVVVLPSRFDGWGMVLNEGASMGKALIGTDRCGSAFHLIREGENGFRVRAESTANLAARMATYADRPGLAKEHGVRSLEIFREFSPERNAERLVEILTRRYAAEHRVGNTIRSTSAC